MAQQKKCSLCLLWKSFDNFHKDGRTKDGFRSICVDCEIGTKYPEGLKKCSKCGQFKYLSDFRKDRRLPDGLRTDCKTCESTRKKQEYDANTDTHRMRKRQFYQDHKQQRHSYNHKYYDDNTQALCDYQRRYRGTNAEKLKAQRKIRYADNPDIFKARANIRRVRLDQLSEHYTAEQWQALCTFYEFACLHCGRRQPDIVLSVDHVIPIARGGSNSIRNIQPLCLECNKKKHTKTIDYRKDFDAFLMQIGLGKSDV